MILTMQLDLHQNKVSINLNSCALMPLADEKLYLGEGPYLCLAIILPDGESRVSVTEIRGETVDR